MDSVEADVRDIKFTLENHVDKSILKLAECHEILNTRINNLIEDQKNRELMATEKVQIEINSLHSRMEQMENKMVS